MLYRGGIPVLLTLLAVTLSAAEPALQPQEGVLLLRNGQVIEGGITRAGDFFVVTLGRTGEIRLPAADVEAQCADLEDAYRYQAALLTRRESGPHLKLAEWCLRNRLFQEAGEQIGIARELEPSSPRITQLQQRIELAAAAPPPTAKAPTTTAVTVGGDELDETLRELPKGSVEKFSVVVQPILLNRCAANGCHGPAATSDFRLLKPAPGRLISKRFTQRNLYSVLQYMDRAHPEESKVLTLPRERHGGTLTPVFDKRSQRQLDDLLAFAKHLAPPEPATPAAPSTITEPEKLLTQPGIGSNTKSGARPVPKSIAPMNAGEGGKGTSPAEPRETHKPAPMEPSVKKGAYVPRDPFDPEIFNRQYLGKTGNSKSEN